MLTYAAALRARGLVAAPSPASARLSQGWCRGLLSLEEEPRAAFQQPRARLALRAARPRSPSARGLPLSLAEQSLPRCGPPLAPSLAPVHLLWCARPLEPACGRPRSLGGRGPARAPVVARAPSPPAHSIGLRGPSLASHAACPTGLSGLLSRAPFGVSSCPLSRSAPAPPAGGRWTRRSERG